MGREPEVGQALTEATVREVLDALRTLLDGQRVMLAALARLCGEPQAAALVRCIAEQVHARAFSVAELQEHAEIDLQLRDAIVTAVGALNGKRLGQLLRSIEGVDFDGLSIVRTGANREGVLWRVTFAT